MAPLQPIVESTHFVNLSSLKINTSLLVENPYIYSVDTNQRVFNRPGRNTFILGDDLHLDDPQLLEHVEEFNLASFPGD